MKHPSFTTAAIAAIAALSGLTSATIGGLSGETGATPFNLADLDSPHGLVYDFDMSEHNITISDFHTLAGPKHMDIPYCGENNENGRGSRVKIKDLVFDPHPASLGQDIMLNYDFELTHGKIYKSSAVQVRFMVGGYPQRLATYKNFCQVVVNPNPDLPCPMHAGNFTAHLPYGLPKRSYNADYYSLQIVHYEEVDYTGHALKPIGCQEVFTRLA